MAIPLVDCDMLHFNVHIFVLMYNDTKLISTMCFQTYAFSKYVWLLRNLLSIGKLTGKRQTDLLNGR